MPKKLKLYEKYQFYVFCEIVVLSFILKNLKWTIFFLLCQMNKKMTFYYLDIYA